MKRTIALLGCLLFAGASSGTVINNGSFETGNFSGWGTQDVSPPFFAQQVGGAGITPGFGFFSSSPTDGSFAALNGFDGAPGVISIFQDITVTSNSIIEFDYRAAWNMQNFGGSTQNRLFDVNIEVAGGGANLASFSILTAQAGTANLDTGDLAGSVDLSAFVGQTVSLNFDWTIPQNFTGPAFFQLDNVRSSPGANVSEPGTVAIFAAGLAGLLRLRRRRA